MARRSTKEAPATVTPLRSAPNEGALIASGKLLNFADESDIKRYRKKLETWQTDAWRYYDTIGEIWFAHQFVGNCLRKIRIFAAEQPDPAEPPTAIDTKNPGKYAQAVAEMERLNQSEGGIGDIMHDLGIDLGVPGEAVLLGMVEPGSTDETWRVYSNSELFVNADRKWVIRQDPTDHNGKPIPDKAAAIRIWRSHPQWKQNADSPMRAILDLCDELLILSKTIRAAGRSRTAGAGMLLWPTETTFGTVLPTEQEMSGENVDPVMADLMHIMLTPIADEGVAASVVPGLFKLPAEYIDKVRLLTFDRPLDPIMAKQRNELIQRMANGLDLPAAVLLGMADLNHWTAWQIDEQTFKAHLEPLVLTVVNALTAYFLRPNIKGSDGADALIWYDPADLVGHPNKAQDAKDAYDRYVLSDEGLRNRLGIPDEEKPSDEEVMSRVIRKGIERRGLLPGEQLIEAVHVTPEQAVQEGGGGGAGPTGNGAVTPGNTGKPNPPAPPATGKGGGAVQGANQVQAGPAKTNPAVTGSGLPTPPQIRQLGNRFADRDRLLRTRLHVAADAATHRALERTGAALRRKAGRSNVAEKIRTVDNLDVAATIGRAAAQRYGFSEAMLIESAFDDLKRRFGTQVAAAQADLRRQIQRLDVNDDIDWDQVETEQQDDLEAGWKYLLVGLTAAATIRLFSGHPDAPPLGESDPDMLLPPQLLRTALSIAGGAEPGQASSGASGVMLGPVAQKLLLQVNIRTGGYEWVAGAPTHPFEPHADLDGQPFQSFDDDVLGADAGEFPFVDHYFPGDHDGCQCDFIPQFQSGGGESDTGEEESAA